MLVNSMENKLLFNLCAASAVFGGDFISNFRYKWAKRGSQIGFNALCSIGLRGGGLSTYDISRLFGISHQCISQIIEEHAPDLRGHYSYTVKPKLPSYCMCCGIEISKPRKFCNKHHYETVRTRLRTHIHPLFWDLVDERRKGITWTAISYKHGKSYAWSRNICEDNAPKVGLNFADLDRSVVGVVRKV